jgi:hypothetical protein
MVREDLGKVAGHRQQPRIVRRWVAGALLLALAGSGLVFVSWSAGGSNGSPPPAAPAAKSPPPLFREWPRDRQPDVAIVLSAAMIGFLKECGCSHPQLGGLDRRYNFLQTLLKDRHWPVVAVDLGDIAQRSGPQALLKYRYSMESLKLLSYTAVGVGENEMQLPLLEALGAYALNNPKPAVLAANLQKKDENFPNMVKSWKIEEAGDKAPRVGVVGVVGPSVAKAVHDADVAFEGNDKVLPAVLKEVQAANPDLLVLLYQGSVEEAKACAERFPQFHVVLCLTKEEEPPSRPEKVGNTQVIGVGHKGRYVGVVGAYRTGKTEPAFDFYYELVAMVEEYATPPDAKEGDNPVLALLEEYSREVKNGNYLAHYAPKKIKHAIQLEPEFQEATYVGSQKCKNCHAESFRVWQNSPHAHAYHTLETATRPSLRQYDGECVACHVTGFGYAGGFSDEKTTPLLKDNGCENCHGPCSLHVKGGPKGLDPKLLALMNPFKTKPNETEAQKTRRVNGLDLSCQKCHDIDNDVHWKIDKWVQGHIVHKEPTEPAPAADGH